MYLNQSGCSGRDNVVFLASELRNVFSLFLDFEGVLLGVYVKGGGCSLYIRLNMLNVGLVMQFLLYAQLKISRNITQ